MIVLVCGGRDYNNKVRLFNVLTRYNEKHGVHLIIHGGCVGADRLSGDWALNRQVPYLVFPAKWDKYGKAAGQMRNAIMLDNNWATPEVCIAFKGGVGTKDMMNRLRRAGLEVFDIEQLEKANG